MHTTERDPQYIADTVRLLRKMLGLTQENLAQAANLSTRTIEKVESGRHRPDEQTLRSIGRATAFDVRVFDKPTPEQEAHQKAEFERAVRKTAIVKTSPIKSPSDFLGAFDQWDAARIDTSAVTDEVALETAAAMADWLRDMNDIWEDCYMSQRLEYARSFVQLCREIRGRGYICYLGHNRERLRQRGKPDLIFTVGLMSILPKAQSEGDRFAVIHLEGAWETLDEDRQSI
jgi:transcriptional regulator with XRE-family HTH domain